MGKKVSDERVRESLRDESDDDDVALKVVHHDRLSGDDVHENFQVYVSNFPLRSALLILQGYIIVIHM